MTADGRDEKRTAEDDTEKKSLHGATPWRAVKRMGVFQQLSCRKVFTSPKRKQGGQRRSLH
jgi:hypothetical protein